LGVVFGSFFSSSRSTSGSATASAPRAAHGAGHSVPVAAQQGFQGGSQFHVQPRKPGLGAPAAKPSHHPWFGHRKKVCKAIKYPSQVEVGSDENEAPCFTPRQMASIVSRASDAQMKAFFGPHGRPVHARPEFHANIIASLPSIANMQTAAA